MDKKKLVACAGAGTALAWLAISPRNQRLYRQRLLFDKPVAAFNQDLVNAFTRANKERHLFRAVDGSQLHSWLFGNNFNSAVALYCMGRSSCITNCLDTVEALLEARYSAVFVYEPRQFGLSEGKASLTGIAQDGISAYDFLVREIGCPADRIFVYGKSLGGLVARLMPLEREVRALVSHSAFHTLEHIAKDHLPFLRYMYPWSWLFPREPDGVLQGDFPKLFIHGDDDEVISHEHSRLLFERAAGPKRFHVLHGGHHGLAISDHDAFVTCLSEFREFVMGEGSSAAA